MAKRIKYKKVEINLPEVMVYGYVFDKNMTIPGKKATSAHMLFPKYMAGEYKVILIPKEHDKEEETLQL